MPLVNIQIIEGRTPDKIEVLMKNVTIAVSESLAAPRENVRVVVTEVPKPIGQLVGNQQNNLVDKIAS